MARKQTDTPDREGDNKVHRYTRAAQLIALGKSFDAVAKELGVNRATLYWWRRDPLFKLILSDIADDALHAARVEFKAMLADAIKVVRESLTCNAADRDEAEKFKVRLAAAKVVLDCAGIDSKKTDGDDLEFSDEQIDEMARRVDIQTWLTKRGQRPSA